MALILDSVSVSLGPMALIAPFSLTVAAGEIVTLMGASGSGKSALLSFIAGDIEAPFRTAGSIVLDDRMLGGVPPERRGIGRLFQDDLLFPHLTAGENILFGMPRGPKGGRMTKMRIALKEAGLEGFEARPPHTLSGGQRARVALMRALAAEPQAMLLDEPFNKLDEELRGVMRAFVFGHLKLRNIPCLMVTHDRADAPPGGRVLRLSHGEVRDD